VDRSNDSSWRPALRRRTGTILFLAYAPLFLWSLVASGWALWHYPFTRVFLLGFVVFAAIPFAFGGRPGFVTFMLGVAGAHGLGAFALHTWLRLPAKAAAVFFLGAVALLLAHAVRAMIAAGSADFPYDR